MLKCECPCHRKDENYPAIALAVGPVKTLAICGLCLGEYGNIIGRVLSGSYNSFYYCFATKHMVNDYCNWIEERIQQDHMVES